MEKLDKKKLELLQKPQVRDELRLGMRGIEKESLRVTPDGKISQRPHPVSLGAAMTHPKITTDYSEALLELVTTPAASVGEAWDALSEIHRFVYSQLGDELLWAASMPCVVGGDSEIPIAQYGSSNVGQMKHVYRRGLGYRYGRVMQVIAGVHFNYSAPVSLWPLLHEAEGDSRTLREFIDDRYFGLLRNFQRLGWLIPYLFGSSPAVCKSFLGGRLGSLSEFDAHTAYGRYATSLRMSDIGYHNPGQAKLDISYNGLDEYVGGLTRAIETPYPPYERIGVKENGEYLQLSTSVLQIANEFYSFARPKQVAMSGEKPTLALKRRGVAYIEVRALDVDPYDPVGIGQDTMRFVETLLLYCLFADSPAADEQARKNNQFNQSRAACCGRSPGITLNDNGSERPLVEWAEAICRALIPVARLLDNGEGNAYEQAVRAKLDQARDPELTPSAKILREMRERGESFFSFAMRQSRAYHEFFSQRPLADREMSMYREMASASVARRAEIEAGDTLSFEQYLHNYFDQA